MEAEAVTHNTRCEVSKTFVRISEAAKTTGLSRAQIKYRMEKGVVSFMEDPFSKQRQPCLEDLMRLKPTEHESNATAEDSIPAVLKTEKVQ